MEKRKPVTQNLMSQLLTKNWKPTSALPIIIFVCILVISVSVLGLRAVLAKRSAAQAMRKLKEVDDARLRALSDAKMAINDESRQLAEKRLEVLDVQLSTIARSLSSGRENHQKYVQSLQSITDWGDVMVVK